LIPGIEERFNPTLTPYKKNNSNDPIISIGVVVAPELHPQEAPVIARGHNGVRNHQFMNSESFHRTFDEKVKRSEDGLMIHKLSGRAVGASNFESHGDLEPLLYRPDGLWFNGNPEDLLSFLSQLPGEAAVALRGQGY